MDRFSVETSDVWEDEDDYQLTPTQSKKFSHFFTHLLDHDHDDLISEQDFGALIEVTGTSRPVYIINVFDVLCMHLWIYLYDDNIEVSTFCRLVHKFCRI